MSVPKAMQSKYDEIRSIIEPYCDEYLNSEYKVLCLNALEKLCRKRPSPLKSGRGKTWAAGIIYAIAQNNWIFDKENSYHSSAQELVDPLGVSKSTAASKAAEIRKMLKIYHYNAEWVIESDIEQNPMIWYVEYNGFIMDARRLPLDAQIYCAEKGFIPYVPALKEKE